MTDRGAAALRQGPDSLTVGPSRMHWDGGRLIIDIDEVSSLPLISRMRGRITLTPAAVTGVEVPLTGDGAHVWRPFAPVAEIEVDLNRTAWQWRGKGYFDANFGTRALETDFDTWTWASYPTARGAQVFYDGVRRDGSSFETGVAFDADGSARTVSGPPLTRFRRSNWGVARSTRADPGAQPRQFLAMLDAPFYSRAAVSTVLDGEAVTGVHEALDLRRFRSPLLKPMLAVRVPRRAGWHWPDGGGR